MSRRTIQSPGVEIREIDLTTVSQAPVGTNIFVAGFSNQGPTDEVINVSDFSSFEDIYGKPTNAAERYFYHSVKHSFDSDANLFVSRLPYGSGNGLSESYTALVYPVVAANTITVTSVSSNGALLLDESRTSTDVSSDLYIELITKDANGDTKYTSASASVTSQIFNGNSFISDSAIAAVVSSVTADTFVAGTVYSTGSAVSGFSDQNSLANNSLSASDYYIFGNPTLVELTQDEYNTISEGNFTWSDSASAGNDATFSSLTSNALGAGLIVLNTAKTSMNNNYEGYYVGVADNSYFNPATNFDAALNQYTATSTGDKTPANYTTVPTSRLDYSLSASSTSEKQNISRTLEDVPTFDIQGADFVDSISLGLFKVRITPFSNSDLKLSYFLAEGYTGSLNSYRKIQNENGGDRVSFFLGDVEDNSPNVKVLVNPYLSRYAGDWTSNNSEAPTKFVRTHRKTGTFEAKVQGGIYNDLLSSKSNYNTDQGIFGLGAYKDEKNTTKNLGSIPDKLDRVFRIAENVDLVNIDVSVEAGLGTVHVNQEYGSNSVLTSVDAFEDTEYLDVGSSTANTGFFTSSENMTVVGDTANIRDAYRTIFNKFEQFARQTRKDHIFIADVLRNLVVQGENTKVLDDKSKNFSQHVYWPLRHQFGSANSNFATVYGNWARVYDSNSDQQVWVPFSGVAAGNFARTDATFAPWYAPAGYQRGVVTGVNDVAISPTQRQRDQLYKISVNPVFSAPNDGIVILGQKTLQRRPSAFDRVNVRRLFLDLEKRTRQTMKQFLFEPNTFRTRNSVVNTLTPIFENAKQTEGISDFLVVVDERNNTPTTIANNELIVDIYLKPVRAAEFIRVNFFAVNDDVDFNELLNQ